MQALITALSRLSSLEYDILDVKSTHWHDDFSAYKKTPEANQAMEAYAALDNSLDEFIRRMFSEWITSIDAGISRFLETFLMQVIAY